MLKVLASPMWMLLKGVYEIIWVFAPILTLVLVFKIGILVIVWLEREISIELVNTYSPNTIIASSSGKKVHDP